MRTTTRHQLGLAAVAAVMFFANLGGTRLWDEDEPKNAECAREMLVNGDYILPRYNELPRFDKPVLLYWLMVGAYRVFGVTEFAARFWSATFGVGTVLCTYHLGRIMFRPETGWWAGLVLTASLLFGVASRAATPDSTLIFFSTLGLLCYVAACVRNGCEMGSATASTRPGLGLSVAMYAALSLAVLAKGPVGVVLPGLVIALFVWCHAPAKLQRTDDSVRWWTRIGRWVRSRLHPVHVWKSLRSLRPLVALVMLSAIALPWYVAVGIETRGEWLEMFLGRHNLERFASTLDGHRGPIIFYLLAVFVGFFPWSILLPQAVRETVRRLRDRGSFSRGDLFLTCWVTAYVGFFSLAGTKLPNYITPCYPALALLTSRMIEGYLAQPGLLDRWSWRVALGSLVLVGVSLVIGLPIASLTILPGEAWLGVVGCVPVAGAWIAWKFSQRGRLDRALQSLAVTALALALALFGVVLPQVDRHQTSENFVNS
ncbi:MAG: glycosyltransferase family 39 protein, partial [Planctomycetales bacterium]|nr:glycosyltransferase family 39 protein [Planctomycetales bacterium]